MEASHAEELSMAGGRDPAREICRARAPPECQRTAGRRSESARGKDADQHDAGDLGRLLARPRPPSGRRFQLPGEALGVDASANMLARARVDAPRALLAHAVAEQLPWLPSTFARVFLSTPSITSTVNSSA